MDTISNLLQESIATIKLNAPFVFEVIALLWIILFVNRVLMKNRLFILGIYPRHIAGIPGIFLSSFLHQNTEHLFFNSIPLFIMMSFVLLSGMQTFYVVTFSIIVLSGVTTWLLARPFIHVGASSLIMGYFGYLLINASMNQTPVAIALAFVLLYYFGGFLFSILPGEKHISWEGHLFGLLAGLFVGYFYASIAPLFDHVQGFVH